MATVPPAGHRTAWLYTRGEDSISVTVDEGATRPVLIICGPGQRFASHDFADLKTLMEFAEGEERRLHAEGFQLQAIAERRTGGDRRVSPRPDSPDRRQR